MAGGVGMLSLEEIEELRLAHSPLPKRQEDYHCRLLITHYSRVNPAASLSCPFYEISDFAGYLTATPSLKVLGELIKLEAISRGAVRELITGEKSFALETPKTITLDDLEIEI
jgi:hypothetical protein